MDFEHSPLTSNQIRLIRLTRGTSPENIKCELESIDLGDDTRRPKYSAISYCVRQTYTFLSHFQVALRAFTYSTWIHINTSAVINYVWDPDTDMNYLVGGSYAEEYHYPQ